MEQIPAMEKKQEIKDFEKRDHTKNEEYLPELEKDLRDNRQRRIILVDDDEEDRQIFTSALEDLHLNAEIGQFNNGVDLMAHLLDPLARLPDLIFLDLNMPLMNGEECLSDIRNEARLNKIPVIIYSGYHDNFKMEILKKKGADHYFLKPNTFPELKRLIQESISSLGKGKKMFRDFMIR